ncbi:hypothetical protein ACWEBH_12145, partial [Micrococcus endophyticus]
MASAETTFTPGTCPWDQPVFGLKERGLAGAIDCHGNRKDAETDEGLSQISEPPPENPNLRHSTVSACVPHQLDNADYGSCLNQDE